MEDMNSAVIVAIISSLSAIVVSIVSLLSTRKKNSADVASVLTGAALEMYESMRADVDKLRAEMIRVQTENVTLNAEVRRLKHELELANDMVNYLFDGIAVLIRQLEESGINPDFVPRPTFRGDND